MATSAKAATAWLLDKVPAKRLQDASRLALGVLILSTLGFCLYDVTNELGWQYSHDLSSSLQWGAVTVLLISAPVLGKVVRTGLERVIGTLAGGLVAYLAALADSTALFIILSGFVAMTGHILGGVFGYEYSGRLLGITYLIIAPTAYINGRAHVVVISRVAGVLSGIGVTFLLSCVWFPTPASELAIDNLHKALCALHTLTEHTWSGLQASRRSAEAQLLLRAISIAQSGGLPEKEAEEGGEGVRKGVVGEQRLGAKAKSAPAIAVDVEMASTPHQQEEQRKQEEQQEQRQLVPEMAVQDEAGVDNSRLVHGFGSVQQLAPQQSPFWLYANASSGEATRNVSQWLSNAEPASPAGRLSVSSSRAPSGAGGKGFSSATSQAAAGFQGANNDIANNGNANNDNASNGASHTMQQAPSLELVTLVSGGGATILSNDDSQVRKHKHGHEHAGNGAAGSAAGATPGADKPILADSQRSKLRASIDSACETALTTLHASCSAAMEALKDAASEFFAGVIGHHRIYLPLLLLGKRGRHRFHMPSAEFTATQSAIRRCARLIWTLHLTLQEGFDQQMMNLLRTRYPVHLLEKLQQSSVAFVADCEAAMHRSQRVLPLPSEPVPRVHLQQFHKAVRVLLEISESQRHQVIDHVRRYTVPPPPPHHAHSGSCQSARFSFSDAAVDEPELAAAAAAAMMDAENAPLVHSRSEPSMGLVTMAESAEDQAGSALQQQQRQQQPQQQQSHSAVKTFGAGDVSGSMQGPAVAASSRASISTALHSNVAQAGSLMSPDLAQAQLPELRVHADGTGGPYSTEGRPVRQTYTSGDGMVSPRPSSVDTALPQFLQRVDTPRLFFPDSSEGFIAKIKWYSFQFLMEQLVEVFDELHTTINALLPRLPGASLSEDKWTLPR